MLESSSALSHPCRRPDEYPMAARISATSAGGEDNSCQPTKAVHDIIARTGNYHP